MAIISLQEALDFIDVEAGYFNIKSINDGINMTSDEGGPSTVDIPDGTYDGDALATALQTAMNNDATLTGGVITFAVSYSSSTRKFTIDATAGKTIAYDHSESDAGLTLGFNADKSAAQTITSDLAAGDPTSIVTEIRDGAEAWIKKHCRRTFESTAYTLRRYDGTGGQYLFLREFPLIYVDRVAVNTLNVIKIRNTTAGASAGVSVLTTGLRLVLNGALDATDVTFATNATLTALVTQINTIGGGWEAAMMNSDYNSYASAQHLLERFGAGAIDSNWIYLDIPDEGIDDFDVYEDEGTLYRYSGWSKGHNNVFVSFTAGYSSTDMPEDIKIAARILMKYLYDKREEGSFGAGMYKLGDLSTTFEKDVMPKEASDILNNYRRRMV